MTGVQTWLFRSRDGFQQVYVLGSDQKVKMLKVTVGRRQGDMIEITTGLPADAEVVVKGAGFLTAGDLVKVVP